MDWNISKGGWKDTNPIGKRAENFILENTQYLVYFRKFQNFTCQDHWDSAKNSPRFLGASCNYCYGFGVKTQPQLIPARLSFGPGSVSLRETESLTVAGYTEYFTTIAHFPRAIKPELEDVVCIAEWDKPTQQLGAKPTGRVLKINSVYLIKTSNDYFEREMAFYSCGLESFDVQEDAISRLLPTLVNIPIVEVQSSWPQNSFW